MQRPLASALVASFIVGDLLATPSPITIEGVFVDAHTGRGIAEARVELKQRHWGFPLEPAETPLATTTTDRLGRFRFVGPWHGRFRIWCLSRGGRKMGIQVMRGATLNIRIESQDLGDAANHSKT